MFNKSKDELKRLADYHKEQLKRIENAMRFDNEFELLLRGKIRERGNLTANMVSKNISVAKIADSNVEFNVSFVREGRKVICTLTTIGKDLLSGVGEATCDVEDKFDYLSGMRLAEVRARKDLYRKIESKLLKDM